MHFIIRSADINHVTPFNDSKYGEECWNMNVPMIGLRKFIPIMIWVLYEIPGNPVGIENQVIAQVWYNQRMKIIVCRLFANVFFFLLDSLI